MGLLNTFFVGSDLDAQAFVDQPQAAGRFETGHFTNIEIAELYAVLQSVGYSVELLNELMMVRSDEEEWIFRFPAGFTSRLATLSDAGIDAAATEWIKFEEMKRCELANAISIIVELRALAVRAVEKQESVFLWISL